MGVPEEREKGPNALFEERRAGNFPHAENTDIQVQKAQRASNKMKQKEKYAKPGHIIIKE